MFFSVEVIGNKFYERFTGFIFETKHNDLKLDLYQYPRNGARTKLPLKLAK
jgi:hypothetical protein